MGMLTGKTAIVTGAGSGIGRAAALLFAREGASVVCIARREAPLRAVVDDIVAQGGQACWIAGDVQDESVHRDSVARAIDAYGGLDVAFNNAGHVGEMGPTVGLSLDSWRSTIETNLTSHFLAVQHQIPAMEARGGGSVIFNATFVGAVMGFSGMAAYGAAKAGLLGLMRTLAVEHARTGVRVNALLPGIVGTPMSTAAASPEEREIMSGLNAFKRMGEPEEIARAALFLASDMASFMTGSSMIVDGGATSTAL